MDKDRDDQIACCDWLDEMKARAERPAPIEQELAKCRAMDIATKRAQAKARQERETREQPVHEQSDAEQAAERAAALRQEIDRKIAAAIEREQYERHVLSEAVGACLGERDHRLDELIEQQRKEIVEVRQEMHRLLRELREIVRSEHSRVDQIGAMLEKLQRVATSAEARQDGAPTRVIN